MARASSSSSGTPAGLLGEEALVARVLQQAAHEVGHAGDEVADRAVGAHAQAARGRARPEVVAEAAQDLQLEVARRRAPSARLYGDRVGDRAQVVRGDRRRGRRGRARRAARTVSASKLRSDSALTSNTGDVQPCWRASTTSWSQ